MAFSRRDFIRTGVGTAVTAAASDGQMLQDDKAKPVEPGKALPQDRMPEIPAEKMTEAQKKAAEEFAAGRKTPVFGPFVPLLRSPDVMLRAKAMGDYLRFNSKLNPKVSEFAILITARHWAQNYIWAVHFPAAINAGLGSQMLEQLADGRNPKPTYESEQLCYDFCTELLQNQSISDATYSWAVTKFGEQGVIDLVGIVGYYTFLSLIMNTTRTALPKDAKPVLPLFPH